MAYDLAFYISQGYHHWITIIYSNDLNETGC